jgi:hypothetical protein
MEEKAKSGSNILAYITIALLGVIVILLLVNLAATTFLIFKSQQAVASNQPSVSEPLPAELSSTQGKEELFEKFRKPFNDRDNEKLYSLLDPLAQVEISKEELDKQLSFIYGLAGEIESGTYSHYDYMGISKGRKWFILYYRVKTDQRPVTVRITVSQEGDEPYTILGFHVDSQ